MDLPSKGKLHDTVMSQLRSMLLLIALFYYNLLDVGADIFCAGCKKIAKVAFFLLVLFFCDINA